MAKRSRGKFGIDEKEQKKAYQYCSIALVPAIAIPLRGRIALLFRLYRIGTTKYIFIIFGLVPSSRL
jgi:hypothetical protein